MNRRILCAALSCFLTGTALPAQMPQSAVVLQSASAKLNTADAAIGTTVFDGDRMETQDKGLLSVRSGIVQLSLSESSTLWMNHENTTITPKLQRGTVTFRTENGTGVEIHADDVKVRAHTQVLTVGEVTLDECYIIVTARTQDLEVTAGREAKVLEEGKKYRVARVGACAAVANHAPLAVGQSRFFLLPAAVAGAVGIWAIHKGLESPDRP